ncbi:MAG TPA: TetR/AcrR family transcriptional regulator [Gemmatimonadales bacterium]|nr:TetR/AcrR family transcriptional regulator [Gemmatimonadales bacterium]
MANVKRSYHSPARRRQAEDTRQKILRSGRELFVTRGYGLTTIGAIAERARLSAPTIYHTFESKRGILMALLDQMAQDADLAGMTAAVAAAAGDPPRQLRARIAFTSRFYAKGTDLIAIARTVSGAEPDLAALWAEGETRRHRAAAALVRDWKREGALADGLSVKEATDTLWAFGGPDVFRLFVTERRWPRRRYEAWLVRTLEGLLFATSASR